MALVCLPRLFNIDAKLANFIACFPKYLRAQTANICSKEWRDPDVKKPAPWPYEKKKFTFFHWYIDGTLKRFDENTKIIVVDGNIGAGKSSFAKELAEAFDMHFLPEPSMEDYFVSNYGYDLRKIDAILPHSYKCCDIATYYANPHHQNVGKFQFRMFVLRLNQYIDALAHLLHTGQGVVLERSVYGDFVFLETMYKFGYITTPARKLYYDIQKNVMNELLRPHLIIYLDVTPEVALERIKKRNNPGEVNSKVLTKEYLQTIEDNYKTYLKEQEKHAEVVIYDWNNYGDVEVVVEDIERIDFDRFSIYDEKMKDWMRKDDWHMGYLRMRYGNQKDRIIGYTRINRPKVTELYHPTEEVLEFHDILEKIPGERYSEGFNADAGDSVWFKTEHEKGYRYRPIFRWHK